MWLPVPHTEMRAPLLKFKQLVQREAEKIRRSRTGESQHTAGLQFKYKDRRAHNMLKRIEERRSEQEPLEETQGKIFAVEEEQEKAQTEEE